MVKYKYGKVYEIINHKNGDKYVGSTTKKYLSSRLSEHVYDYRNNINNCTSHKLLKNGDYDIKLLEKVPCNNRKKLFEREGYYVNLIDCVNKEKPSGKNMKLNFSK
jgi:hypothetical protein